MAYSNSAREEEIKNRLRKDYFSAYDAEQILGNIDFVVAMPAQIPQLFETEYLLWAEAKKGSSQDIYESLVQLILTIGKARTFEKHLPPAFLGAFDASEIAFIPYNSILEIFYQNDFNWNVTPSNHTTREFRIVMQKVRSTLERNMLMFSFDKDDKDLRRFIKSNFKFGKSGVSKVRINKNNFTAIYQKWLTEVQPSINVNWETAKKHGIIDADFYLADILSEHNVTLRNSLFVLLRKTYYELDRKIDDAGLWDSKKAEFNDKQVAHTQFWNRYERPPKREYWEYIAGRRDLLVPQDVRERKGSFFTPHRWVELSQQYLASELGDNWQDEYYIWDCCGGTGNLEAGLTNKYRIWVSTLDKADVDVMHDRIRHMNEASTNGQGSNLLDSHVFQFDFLNDPFDIDKPDESKLPKSLIEVLKDDTKRRHLVIYINPPYAEASNARTVFGTGVNRKGLSDTKVKTRLKEELGRAGNEIFAQFFARIVTEIPNCVLAAFSKLKTLQGPNFTGFRNKYKAKLCRIFLVPAYTFDNVVGQFPIGFQIFHTDITEQFEHAEADVYDATGKFLGKKKLHAYDNGKLIIDWYRQFYDKSETKIAYLRYLGTDFQNNRGVFITLSPSANDLKQVKGSWITPKNLIEACVYFTVRLCIPATWINDRDQFLYPNDNWSNDKRFQTDCIVYTSFSMKNNVSSKFGINYWIPFTEEEVNAQESFESHFMSEFLRGKQSEKSTEVVYPDFYEQKNEAKKLTVNELSFIPLEHLSAEAKSVMESGRELWRYYHAQPNANPNASFYDIRLHFQGYKNTKSGKIQMNPDSSDETYKDLIASLRYALKKLAIVIAPKVYEYGFLLK